MHNFRPNRYEWTNSDYVHDEEKMAPPIIVINSVEEAEVMQKRENSSYGSLSPVE